MKKLLIGLHCVGLSFLAMAQKPALSNSSTVKVAEGSAVAQYTLGEVKTFVNTGATSGTVTSVGITVPTGLTVNNSPVTSSGTIAILNNMTAGVVKSAGVGGALSSGAVALNTETSGTLSVANGGTGSTTLTGYIKGSGTTAMTASTTIPTTDLSGTISNAQLANNSISNTVANAGTAVAFTTSTTALGSTLTLNAPIATASTTTGVVSNAAQTFGGIKTFSNGAIVTGAASVAAMEVNGTEKQTQFVTTAASTTLDLTYNNIRIDASAANRTVVLPTCSAGNVGIYYIFTRIDSSTTNSATLSTADAFIGGGTTRTLWGLGTSVTCSCGAAGIWDIKF